MIKVKETTILKALNMMDEKRLEKFLADDCRDIGEIIEALREEEEKEYVAFMGEVYSNIDKLEEEEKKKLSLDNYTKVMEKPYILSSTKNMNSSFDNMAMPLLPPQNIFDNLVKSIDYSKFIKGRD